MNAIVPVPPAAAPAVSEPLSMLNFIAAAVSDPAVDVRKLETLLRMQRELQADEAKRAYHRAMTAAQAAMVQIVRDTPNEHLHTKYASLEAVDTVIRPIYTGHGFTLSFDSEPLDGDRIRVWCEVTHIEGHTRAYSLDAPPDTAGPKGAANKTPIQGIASSVSYLRRYLTTMIFNIVTKGEDQDGNRTHLLTSAQRTELTALMRETNTPEGRFLAHMYPDAAPPLRDLGEAPARDFPRLRNALVTKREILAKRAQRSAAP